MSTHFLPYRQPLRGRRRAAAVAAAAAACLASLGAAAGQAGSGFDVSVTLLPPDSGSCTAASSNASTRLTCRPTLVSTRGGAGSASERGAGAPVLGYRLPEAPLKLAGEMIEVTPENYYAWTENNYLAWGEYSSRLVTAGGVEYVEMTVSW